MINPKISLQDKETLNYERQHHPHHRVRQRMETLWLKSEGVRHQEICRFVDISSTTVTQYLKTYQAHGLGGLKAVNFRQQTSELESFRLMLTAYFDQHPPASVKQAMSDIERLTGIHRSENRVRLFLNSLGMKRRKAAMIPAKADVKQQEDFKKKSLNHACKKRENISG